MWIVSKSWEMQSGAYEFMLMYHEQTTTLRIKHVIFVGFTIFCEEI